MIITPHMETVAAVMIRHACVGHAVYDGRNDQTPYFKRARRIDYETGTTLLFTRDVGMHTSGWFKNPDYDRCYHLSVSFFDPEHATYRPFDHILAEAWVRAFYRDWVRFIWHEGPTGW